MPGIIPSPACEVRWEWFWVVSFGATGRPRPAIARLIGGINAGTLLFEIP